MLLFTIILMDLLTGMEFDLFVPSFPEIQNHFQLSPFWVEALLSSNFIGYCLSLFFVGVLADRYGRKPIILIGLLLFVIGSLLCLWGGIYPLLLIGRFLQGLGIAAPSILSFLIIADTYPIKDQQFFMAMLNGSKNLAVAAAPVIGSYITMYCHWQGNFSALLLLGSITLLMTYFCIPNFALPEKKETLSLRGYLPILRSAPLMLMVASLSICFVPYWIFVGMSPLLYLKSLGVTLEYFGFYQGCLAFTFAIGSIIFGFVLQRSDPKKMMKLSNIIFITSIVLITSTVLFNVANPVLITFSMLVFVIGQIIPSTIIYPICLNYIPHLKGRTSGLMNGISLVLQSIGVQTAGHLYNGTFRSTGLIIAALIVVIIVIQFYVIQNRDITQNLSKFS